MTRICAHRGASGHAPENTLAALLLAVDQGADMAEFDVQLTADGQAVLIHDETVDRTTDGSGRVADLTLKQLQKLDAGRWFGAQWAAEQLPLLEQVMQAVGNSLVMNIELKGSAGQELETEVVRVIRRCQLESRCLLTSFDHDRIDRLAVSDPDLKLGYIVGQGQWRWGYLDQPVQVLSLDRSLITPERVAAAHETGKEVHVWTVNEPPEMRELMAQQVDAIITNFPDLARAQRRSK